MRSTDCKDTSLEAGVHPSEVKIPACAAYVAQRAINVNGRLAGNAGGADRAGSENECTLVFCFEP